MEIVKGATIVSSPRGFRQKCGTLSWAISIQIAVLFGGQRTFSDAAYKISQRAKPILFKEGWQRIFEPADIREQVRDITTK
jgi:hypothetical protein